MRLFELIFSKSVFTQYSGSAYGMKIKIL